MNNNNNNNENKVSVPILTPPHEILEYDPKMTIGE